MKPPREDLRDDLLATLAASRELSPDEAQPLAAAFLDRLQSTLNKSDASHWQSDNHSNTFLQFVESLSGALSGAIGLGALAHANHVLTAAGPIILGNGYSRAYGNVQFSHVMSVVNPFFITVGIIFVLIAMGACLHSLRRSRSALWVLGGSIVALLVAAFMVLGQAGPAPLEFLLAVELPSPFILVTTSSTVGLALVAVMAGASIESSTPRKASLQRASAGAFEGSSLVQPTGSRN